MSATTTDAGADQDAGTDVDATRDAATEGCRAGVTLTHGPMLGAVSDRSIRIWVRGNRPGRFLVRLWPEDVMGASGATLCTASIGFDEQADLTGVALIEGLEASTSYAYRIEVGSSDDPSCFASASETLTFRTLPRAGEPARIR
jgi:hypothetical protein